MTIDETIVKLKNEAEEYRMQEALENQSDLFWNARKCRICAEEKEQIADWLEELKAYKTWDEFMDKFMHYNEEVAYTKGFNDGCAKFSMGKDYEDGIDDFVRLYEDTISSSIAYALNHTDEEYHTDIELIYRLAKQLKDGVGND